MLGPFYVPGSPPRAFGASMLVDDDPGERVVDPRPGHRRRRQRRWPGSPSTRGRTPRRARTPASSPACSTRRTCAASTSPTTTAATRSARSGPVPYPIPSDGPVGRLLKANGRNWWRPGHTHLWFSLTGYKPLITHVFDGASEHLDDDAVFGTRASLVRTFAPDATASWRRRSTSCSTWPRNRRRRRAEAHADAGGDRRWRHRWLHAGPLVARRRHRRRVDPRGGGGAARARRGHQPPAARGARARRAGRRRAPGGDRRADGRAELPQPLRAADLGGATRPGRRLPLAAVLDPSWCAARRAPRRDRRPPRPELLPVRLTGRRGCRPGSSTPTS